MGNIHRSGGSKKSNDSIRLVFTTIIGMVFGYFIGVSFPSVSLARINISSNFMPSREDSLKPVDRSFPENLGSGNTPTIPKIFVPTNPRGAQTLPPGIIVPETDYMLRRLWGDPNEVCTYIDIEDK